MSGTEEGYQSLKRGNNLKPVFHSGKYQCREKGPLEKLDPGNVVFLRKYKEDQSLGVQDGWNGLIAEGSSFRRPTRYGVE